MSLRLSNSIQREYHYQEIISDLRLEISAARHHAASQEMPQIHPERARMQLGPPEEVRPEATPGARVAAAGKGPALPAQEEADRDHKHVQRTNQLLENVFLLRWNGS